MAHQPITLVLERTIAAPVEAVFDWLADARNYTAALLVLRVKRARAGDGAEWGVGAVREVTCAGAWFREQITAYDRPREHGYQIIKAIPGIEHQGGTIRVTEVAGGSHVVWMTVFSMPPAWGGGVMARLFAPILRWSFGTILRACGRALTGA